MYLIIKEYYDKKYQVYFRYYQQFKRSFNNRTNDLKISYICPECLSRNKELEKINDS